MATRTKKFIKNVGVTSINKFFLIIIGLLSSIQTARLLGVEERGIFGLITAMSGMGVQILNLGIPTSLLFHISKEKSEACYGIGNCIIVVIASIILSLIFLTIGFIFHNFAYLNGINFIFVLILIPVQLSIIFFQNYLISMEMVKYFNLFNIINAVCLPVSLFLFSMFLTVTIITVLLASLFIQILLLLLFIFKIKIHVKISFNKFRQYLSYGYITYISGFLKGLIKTYLGIFMVNRFCNLNEIGLYTLSVSIVSYIGFIPETIFLFFFTEIVKVNNNIEQKRLVLKMTIGTGIILSVICIFGILLLPLVFPFLYGNDFSGAVPILQVLLIAMLLRTIIEQLSNYFIATKERLKLLNIYLSIIVFIQLFVCYYFTKEIGIMGIAIGYCVTYIAFLTIFGIFSLSFKQNRALIPLVIYELSSIIFRRKK